MNNEIKFDHFKNLEELKQNVENWLATDEIYWERWFGLGDIKTLLDIITNLDEKYKKSCETYQQALDETMSEKMDLEKENEDLREDNYAYHQLMKMQNKREFRSKFLKEFQEEFGKNVFPDYDEIYKRYDKVKKENKKLNILLEEIKNEK